MYTVTLVWGGGLLRGQRLCGGQGLICPRTLSYVHCELMRGRGRGRSTDRI